MEEESGKAQGADNQVKCEADEIWNILGKAWTLLILKKLSENKSTRFNEIQKSIPAISNAVLSERLRDLENHGLITKKIYAQVPIRVEYSITAHAHELGKVLKQLDSWVVQWRKENPKKK